MKKTITMMAIAALFTASGFAQNHRRNNDYGYNRDRDVVANNDHRGSGHGFEKSSYSFSARERDIQLASINRQYNRKIESVQDKRFMNRRKKEGLIYALKVDRDAELRSVMAKYNNPANRLVRRDDRYNKHDNRGNW